MFEENELGAIIVDNMGSSADVICGYFAAAASEAADICAIVGFRSMTTRTTSSIVSMPAAVGNSLLVIAINSATALASRAGAGIALDWTTIGAFAAVAVVGSLLGSRVAARVSPRTLSITFIVMLVAVSAYMAAASIPLLVA